MLHSRPLQTLCCLTQATLFNACLSRSDLVELGVWSGERSRRGFSPEVRCRALLHRRVQQDPAVAARVSDRLDLAFLDTIAEVRSVGTESLERTVELWLADPDGRALPGLLWALCTDPRAEACELGSRLCHEATTLALRTVIDSVRGRSASASDQRP